jgi:pimeloyl-[acyl-carrier protein] methyl ester esterase
VPAAAHDVRLHVDVAREGRPLVQLHGYALHGGVFAALLPTLARTRRVLAVDLPGHGHSPMLEPYTLPAIARTVDAAVQRVAGDDTPVDVLGWSFGGQVAMALARQSPARVRRLVLACTTPSFVARDAVPCAMGRATLQRFGDELRVAYVLTLQRFLTLQVQGSESGRRTLAALRARLFERSAPAPAALAATLALLQATDLRAEVPHIAMPALVLCGPRDTLAPCAAAEWLAAALPDARLALIDGAAHAPFLSPPEAFVATVQAFLDG